MFQSDQECIEFLKGLEVPLTELLDLLVVDGRLPHQRLLGKIYVNDQGLEKLLAEQQWWGRQYGKKRPDMLEECAKRRMPLQVDTPSSYDIITNIRKSASGRGSVDGSRVR